MKKRTRIKLIRLGTLAWIAFGEFAPAQLFAATGVSVSVGNNTRIESVALTRITPESYCFEARIKTDTAVPNDGIVYSYKVTDTSQKPLISVWSGYRTLPADPAVQIEVSKQSLAHLTNAQNILVFSLFDSKKKIVLAEAATKPFQTVQPLQSAEVLAFPDAQGFGALTQGGRNGSVYKVTTVEDYDKNQSPIIGSLRYAVEQAEPRTVLFGVSGNIKLKRDLLIEHGNLTVSGNTAPFPGVTVIGQVRVRAGNVILRYLRVRLDVEAMREQLRQGLYCGEWDTINASRFDNIIFDHISASHSVDETFSFTEVDRTTSSCNLIAHALKSVFHEKSKTPQIVAAKPHNFGGLVAFLGKTDRHVGVSVLRNVYAHDTRRMPGFSAHRTEGLLTPYIDVRNNLMYNWKDNAAGSESPEREILMNKFRLNFIGNYFKPGLDTLQTNWYCALTVRGALTEIFMQGNIHDSDGLGTNQKKLVRYFYDKKSSDNNFIDRPFDVPHTQTLDHPAVEDIANNEVGASLPCRDDIDSQVIKDIKEGTGRHSYADMEVNKSPAIPDLPFISHVYCSSDDVFPIWWKLASGLSADARINPLGDSTGDGYTNIEKYMYDLSLCKTNGFVYLPFPFGTGKEHWKNKNIGAEIFSDSSGVILIASSSEIPASAGSASRGIENIIDGKEGYWSSGNQTGPHSIVISYPDGGILNGLVIAKYHVEEIPSQFDPKHIVIQGLLGWPDQWGDLVEINDLPKLTADHPVNAINIPVNKRAFYRAYRLLIFSTHTTDGCKCVKIDEVRFNVQ